MTAGDLLTPAEVGEALGRSPRWVRERARAGAIGYVKVGQSFRFTVEHLMAYIAANSHQPRSQPRSAPWGYPGRRVA